MSLRLKMHIKKNKNEQFCHFPEMEWCKKIVFKSQAFPEMPRQLQKKLIWDLDGGQGLRGCNPLLGHVKS